LKREGSHPREQQRRWIGPQFQNSRNPARGCHYDGQNKWRLPKHRHERAHTRLEPENAHTAGPTPDHDDCHAAARRLAAGDLYFLCGLNSQKATNLARDDRVSLTIDHDTPDIMAVTGLSMPAHARAVLDPAEASKVLRMLPLKYPEQASLPVPMPGPEDVQIFRVMPTVISVLDYAKGFGHTDLVTC